VRVVAAAILFFGLLAGGFSQSVRLAAPKNSPAAFTFDFQTISNQSYAVNSGNLLPPYVWETLTNLQGNGSTAQIRDPGNGAYIRVYRVFTESALRYLTVGHVGPGSARLAIGLDRARKVSVIFSTNANLLSVTTIGTFSVSAADDFTRSIDLTGLQPNTAYHFNVLVDGRPYYDAPYPGFRTAVLPGTPGRVQFAFGSCFMGTSAGGYGSVAVQAPRVANRIWQSIASKQPNFFLHLGDTAYCDNFGGADLPSYRLIHRHALDERLTNMSAYAEFRKHYPFYSTLDDHEIRNDSPWSPQSPVPWSPLFFQFGRQAYREYAGRGNPDPIEPGELYYNLQFGNVGIFVTDTRSFRSCQQGEDSLADISSDGVTIIFNGSLGTASGTAWNGGSGFTTGLVGRTLRLANGQSRFIIARISPTQISVSAPVFAATTSFTVLGKTILGATQKQHLKNWLLDNNSSLRVKFIASATPINGLSEHITAKDAWGAGYEAELNEILDFTITNGIRNVVFLSGDQHWAGSFNRARSGVNFFEFMSSPIFSGGYPMYNGTNTALLSRVNWMFDANLGPHGAENFGLVTVHTETSPATVRFELFDSESFLLNSTLLRETSSGLSIAP
jgi:phosphodiesterase/alkaline phosphatase D-like protein